MTDLKNHRLIYLKGFLFLLLGILSAGTLLVQFPQWSTAMLVCLTVWSFCRFYYFAFYVIGHYVDDQYRFSGLCDFAFYLFGKRLPESAQPHPEAPGETSPGL